MSGSKLVLHVRDARVVEADWLNADIRSMTLLSRAIAAKYCLARVYRPHVIDLFADDRFFVLTETVKNWRGFVPRQITLDTNIAPLIVAVQYPIGTRTELTNKRVYNAIQFLVDQEPRIRQVSVHVFVSNMTNNPTLAAPAVQAFTFTDSLKAKTSFHIHSNSTAVSQLHHFILADIFIGSGDPVSVFAAFARSGRLTLLPSFVPLQSVLLFDESSAVRKSAFSSKLGIDEMRNSYKFRTHRECQELLDGTIEWNNYNILLRVS